MLPAEVARLATQPEKYGMYTGPDYPTREERSKPFPWVEPKTYVMHHQVATSAYMAYDLD